MPDFRCILDPNIDSELLYREQPVDPIHPIHIHLGGLFNSFYPYDWLEIAGSKSFKINIVGAIQGTTISIFLHTPKAPLQIIKQQDATLADEEIELTLTDFFPKPGQRLTCQIESSRPIDLESVSWTAISNSVREVKLGIVICTYNNEARLKQNIQQLIASETWAEDKPILILINNGEIKDESWFPDKRFYKFDQENLGGSGGFGRGIYETVYGTLKDEGITHIILMDDDVCFHPEIIGSAAAFHKKSRQPVVIGGSMLKLDDPTWLHEAGSHLNSIHGIATSTDIPIGLIEKTEALDYLGKATQYDYNAWWFCSLPTDAVRAVGLPLPLFLHGDDIEYGIRLKANGFPTYCPGGISLWHESFEGKRLTWMRYFDCRNGLIRLTTHSDNTKNEVITEVHRLFQRFIMKNDYGACAMVIDAYKDFCSGPKILYHKDFSNQINQLNQLYSKYMYSLVESDYTRTINDTSAKKANKLLKWLKKLTVNMAYLKGKSHTLLITKNTRYEWWVVPYYADIIVVNKGENFFFPRDYKTARKLRVELKEITNQHSDNLDQTINRWRDHMELFTSPDFWAKYLYSSK